MSGEWALIGVIALPIVHALAVALLSRPPGLRDVIHVGFALAQAVCAVQLAVGLLHDAAPRIVLARPLPQVELAFAVEPLGALTAAVIACLSVLQAAHTSGSVRALQSREPARMMAFIALAHAATAALCFSANLFTFFVAYQALTLAAFPLVAHEGDAEARRAARVFLATLLTASVGLFLPAMVWTYALAGAIDFRPGGVLAGRLDAMTANFLLALFALGIAMTAIPPVHRWLSAASGSHYPALVSIQALCVLPAGAIGLLKVTSYVFGPALGEARYAAFGLLALAGAGMCIAALVALSKQDLRERLAYSSMAQALGAATGALIALPAGAFAATLQIVALACAGATLTMAAGTVFAAAGRRNAADYPGLGRAMPWTFGAFAVASASMIGMPPFSGAWAKLWLITAAADAGMIWAAALAGLTAILTFAHLGPLAASALASEAPPDPFKRPDGASLMLVAPVVMSAAATLWLLLTADPLASYLAPLWEPPP
ncbi:MAG: proton-conducting transporter membrane subunit [Hyphomonadaceae bacterium]